jgi:hypothetical protein
MRSPPPDGNTIPTGFVMRVARKYRVPSERTQLRMPITAGSQPTDAKDLMRARAEPVLRRELIARHQHGRGSIGQWRRGAGRNNSILPECRSKRRKSLGACVLADAAVFNDDIAGNRYELQ